MDDEKAKTLGYTTWSDTGRTTRGLNLRTLMETVREIEKIPRPPEYVLDLSVPEVGVQKVMAVTLPRAIRGETRDYPNFSVLLQPPLWTRLREKLVRTDLAVMDTLSDHLKGAYAPLGGLNVVQVSRNEAFRFFSALLLQILPPDQARRLGLSFEPFWDDLTGTEIQSLGWEL